MGHIVLTCSVYWQEYFAWHADEVGSADKHCACMWPACGLPLQLQLPHNTTGPPWWPGKCFAHSKDVFFGTPWS